MDDLRKQVRVARTLGEVERLRNEFLAWKKHRDAADTKQQYQTQLRALRQVVLRALEDIAADTRRIPIDDLDVGSVYAQCRDQEKRLLWVRRVLWGYFRERFDQRDQSKELRKLLGAADDVVWSCYAEVKRQIAPHAPLAPIPLAYIEPFYSPKALPRDEPPGLLKERRLGSDFLADFFTRLPIPLVSMPPETQASPWWLIYLGHEVGHHVQHDFGLVDSVADLLFDVATQDPPPVEEDQAAQRWYDWGQEIFADAFSVYLMGAAAVWAMVEMETHPDREMLLRNESYPSPAARLALLAEVADRLHLDGSAALRGEDPAARLARSPADDFEAELQQELAADLGMVDKVAAALTSHKLGQAGTLEKLTGWNGADLRPAGALGDWQAYLIKGQESKGKQALRSARLIVSAGIESWATVIASTPQANWGRAAAVLGERVLDGIDKYRDKTTRAADIRAVADVDAVAADISERLRHAEFSDG